MVNPGEKSIIEIRNKITLNEVNPYIRRASKHYVEGGLNTGLRVNIHYQLHYILAGTGIFTIGNQVYDVSEGDFLIWCPGQVHRIISDKENPLKVFGIQFDFTRNFCDLQYPCIHFSETSFNWEMVNEIVNIEEFKELTPYTQVIEKKQVKNYLEDIVSLYDSNSNYSSHIIGGLLKAIIILVLEGNSNNDSKFKIKKVVIKNLLTYINKHQQDKLTNKFLGNKFGYHPNHLNQMFLTHTGFTIQQYIIHIRMNKAIDLLMHTNQSISEIGNEVGHYSIHYFSRLFKNKTGLSPSEYRK